jgi:hypothetical protein
MKLALEVPHELTAEQAKNRLQTEFEQRKTDLEEHASELQTNWSGNTLDYSFSAFGFKVKGVLHCLAKSIKIDAELPFPAMMFRSKIEQGVREGLGNVLA